MILKPEVVLSDFENRWPQQLLGLLLLVYGHFRWWNVIPENTSVIDVRRLTFN